MTQILVAIPTKNEEVSHWHLHREDTEGTHTLTDKLNQNEAVVCVVGPGYVGLPLAIEFSKSLRVIGYVIDEDKIKRLNNSESNQENKNLFITNDPAKIRDADFVIISVPTPVTRSQEPDLSYVESAAETISENLKRNFLRKNLVKPSGIPLRSSQIIVSGMDEETTDIVSKPYARITTVYAAKDIRTAETVLVDRGWGNWGHGHGGAGGLLRCVNGMISWMSSRRYWREYMFNIKQIIGGIV